MDGVTAMTTTIAVIGTILSIVFAIMAFARNKTKDATDTSERLAKIETDISYIRVTLDKRESWEHEIEQRVRTLESK